VLAAGRLVTASAKENDDLFWAIRGGGGNFGIVTSFLFRGCPVDQVFAGPMLWEMEHAREVLQWYREISRMWKWLPGSQPLHPNRLVMSPLRRVTDRLRS
jgi:hypothetical protein